MMKWKVAEGDDAWIGWEGGALAGDPETLADVTEALTSGWAAVGVVSGPLYTPTGPDDEVGAYLWALELLFQPTVSGEPPVVGKPSLGAVPNDVVF